MMWSRGGRAWGVRQALMRCRNGTMPLKRPSSLWYCAVPLVISITYSWVYVPGSHGPILNPATSENACSRSETSWLDTVAVQRVRMWSYFHFSSSGMRFVVAHPASQTGLVTAPFHSITMKKLVGFRCGTRFVFGPAVHGSKTASWSKRQSRAHDKLNRLLPIRCGEKLARRCFVYMFSDGTRRASAKT